MVHNIRGSDVANVAQPGTGFDIKRRRQPTTVEMGSMDV